MMHANPSPPPGAVRSVLLSERGLRYDATACLPLRQRAGGCEACARVCPVEAIMFGDDSPSVRESCTGCGRCAAACPMGALDLPGFEPAGASTLECRRVPEGLLTRGAAVVPCLGGLDTAALVAAHGRTGEGPVLVDRGLCKGCPSGGPVHPSTSALEHARDLLESVGVPIARLPVLVRRADTDGMRQAEAESFSASRRSFFARIGSGTGRTLSHSLGLHAAEPPPMTDALRLASPGQPSRARMRLLSACLETARTRALPMPFGLFRAASVDDNCCDRAVCTAVCPTAALSRAGTEATTRLVFNALRCIDCGACTEACPESALRLHERMDEGWREPEVLKHFGRQPCTHCGELFTVREGETECEPCTKSQSLMRDAMRQLFAPRARASTDTSNAAQADRLAPFAADRQNQRRSLDETA